MDALRQRPLFAALATTSPTANQIRETCATVRDHLRAAPDDLTALVLCEVLVDLAPTRDPELVAHRDRFGATRADDWREQGRVRGIHRLLFHLADGARGARLDAALVSALEGRAVELSESRPAGVPPGHIDASLVPAVLAADAGFHPDGHLAQVRVDRGAGRQGQLQLGPRPGAGTFFSSRSTASMARASRSATVVAASRPRCARPGTMVIRTSSRRRGRAGSWPASTGSRRWRTRRRRGAPARRGARACVASREAAPAEAVGAGDARELRRLRAWRGPGCWRRAERCRILRS